MTSRTCKRYDMMILLSLRRNSRKIKMKNIIHGSENKTPLRTNETIIIIVLSSFFLSAFFMVIIWRGQPLANYVRDPAATFSFSPLAGIISHLGVFALLTAGTINVFAFFHANRDKLFLLFAGLFSLVIAMDDFFMLHEEIIPYKIGIPEIYVMASYGLFFIVVCLMFRSSVIGLSHVGLYASLCLLLASVIVDLVLEYSEKQAILEDSFKFIGLIVWSIYWIRRAHFAMPKRY